VKTINLLFIFLLVLGSCNPRVKNNSLAKTIIDVTKKEFQKRSVELDNVVIDSLSIETVNLMGFYSDRISNFTSYLADAERANLSRIEELTKNGDTVMANKIKANHLKNLKIASDLDSLHYKADSSIKILKAVYLLNAKFQSSTINQKVIKYFYQKDTTEVVIEVSDPIMYDIVNGNDYLTLLMIGQAIKKPF